MLKFIILLICIAFPFKSMALNNESLLFSYYSTIIEKHEEPITAERIAIDSLSGLSDVDDDLYFADGKKMVYLYYKRQQVALWHKPHDAKDIKIWSNLADKAINAAIKFSPKAAQKDYEVADKVMAAGAQSLDDFSRYYAETDLEEEYKPIKNFGRRMIKDILYIKIGRFSASTPQNVQKALDDYKQARGIILDLRGNHGGLLTSAIDTAGLFIDGGIITSVKGRDKKKVKYYNAPDKDNMNLPMIVLIDANTASSAEVVAAALSEQAQAELLGTNSFGKGSIQEMYQFENEGKLALTTAHFYTPADKKIDKVGLTPDYCTYHISKNDSLDKILNRKYKKCTPENREGQKVDLDIALKLLK